MLKIMNVMQYYVASLELIVSFFKIAVITSTVRICLFVGVLPAVT